MKNEITTLYKYVPVKIVESLLKDKTIRLCDIAKSNDSTELMLQYNVINKALKEAFERKRKEAKYINKIKWDKLQKEIENKVKHIVKSERNIHTQYASCFSSNGDQLSEWRSYGQTYEILLDRKIKDAIKKKESKYELNDNDIKFISGVSIGYNRKIFDTIGKIMDLFLIELDILRTTIIIHKRRC